MIARIAALLALVCLAGMLSTSVMAAPDAATGTVLAQATPDRALTAGRPAPGAPAAEPGMFAGVYNWLLTQQQRLNRELANAVKDLKRGRQHHRHARSWLHRIQLWRTPRRRSRPRQGDYLVLCVSQIAKTVRRGIMLSFLSAFIQALSAIVLVGILFIVLNKTSMEMSAAERWIETISWAFVAAVGAWLLVGQVRQILARRSRAPAVKTHTHARAPAAAAHDHTHVHTHDCGCDHHHHEAQSHNHHAH